MVNLKTLIIEAILSESRITDFRERYPNLDRRAVDYAIENDPSGNYKYLDWIGKVLSEEPDARVEDLIKYIDIFHNKLKNQDVYKFKSFKDLKQTVDTRPKSHKEILQAGAHEIVNDDDWLVVAPETHDACRYYGGGTKWCIATSNDEYWNQYYYGGTIVIVKDRNTGERIAITAPVESSYRHWTFTEENDQSIGDGWYLELPEYVREKIEDYIDLDDVEERGQEYEQKLIDDFIENEGLDSLIGGLEDRLETDYSLPDNAKNISLKQHLIYTLGSEEKLNQVLIGILYDTVAYHGRDEIGHIGSVKQFKEFVSNSRSREEVTSIENAITNYVLARRDTDKYLEMIQQAVTPQAYHYLYYTLDIDEKIDAAIQSYSKRMNDPSQMRFSQSVVPHSVESVKIENVNDIIHVLQRGGYEHEAGVLQSYLTMKETYRRAIRKLMKLL
jgi:thiaminase